MCGITGFVNISAQHDAENDILLRMLNKLDHRGPDDTGHNLFHKDGYVVALGHKRLSILDVTSNGHQPMFFEDLAIVFNGEIYNFQEIRDTLLAKGYVFSTESDTEVILKAYHAYGTRAFEMFNGMWAIVLYDRRLNQLLLCRDRSGVKPLYWYLKGDVFLFSSELKAFHEYPGFEKEIDKRGSSCYFQYGYIKEPYTIFMNCYKLEAGHFLRVNLDSSIQIEKEKFWDVKEFHLKPKLEISTSEALQEIEKRMIKGFNYRMVSDVPVGVFLSGGIDSALVTSILQSTAAKPLKTFTIGFDNQRFNEAPFAKNISKYLGTEHYELYCDDADVHEMVGLLPDIMDEPFADSSIIPTLLVSKFARMEVTVALSADGGDELFGGYSSYQDAVVLTEKVKKNAVFIKNVLAPVLKRLPIDSRLIRKYNSKINKIIEFAGHPDSVLANYEVINKQIFDREIIEFFGCNPEPLFDFNNESEFSSALSAMLASSYKTYMNNDVLYKMDKATMAFSLEGREPFLDHNLVEFVAQLPDNLKINNGDLKWASKQILFKYLPKELYHGKKMGFSIPQSLLSREVYSKLNDHRDFLCEIGFKRDFYTEKNTEWRIAWNLYIYVVWFNKWMN